MKNKNPIPKNHQDWLVEIAKAYQDARDALVFAPMKDDEPEIGEHDLFQLAPIVCLKFRGIPSTKDILDKTTEASLSSYIATQDKGQGDLESPQMAFAFCYMASHFALDLIDENEATILLDFIAAHQSELSGLIDILFKSKAPWDNPVNKKVFYDKYCQREKKLMKNNLKKSVSVYQFKIKLNHVTPSVWRRFQVCDDITLQRLSTTILLVMGWDGGHLHRFRIQGVDYGIPYEDFEEEDMSEDEREILLRDIPQGDLKKFIYEYDFGDDWKHTVVLEKIVEPQNGVEYPMCLEGARRCPPDDCGGVHGYENLLKIIKDPKHSEYESMMEWLDGEFDPEEFDLEGINDELKRIDAQEESFDG